MEGASRSYGSPSRSRSSLILCASTSFALEAFGIIPLVIIGVGIVIVLPASILFLPELSFMENERFSRSSRLAFSSLMRLKVSSLSVSSLTIILVGNWSSGIGGGCFRFASGDDLVDRKDGGRECSLEPRIDDLRSGIARAFLGV